MHGDADSYERNSLRRTGYRTGNRGLPESLPDQNIAIRRLRTPARHQMMHSDPRVRSRTPLSTVGSERIASGFQERMTALRNHRPGCPMRHGPSRVRATGRPAGRERRVWHIHPETCPAGPGAQRPRSHEITFSCLMPSGMSARNRSMDRTVFGLLSRISLRGRTSLE